MGGEYCTTFCNELLNVSVQTKQLGLPVGRSQHSLKFPTSEATIPEVAAATVREKTNAYSKVKSTTTARNDPGVPLDSEIRPQGLPGQQPDGQVDEVLPAVDDCRGLLVEGGGTTSRPRRVWRLPVLSNLMVV